MAQKQIDLSRVGAFLNGDLRGEEHMEKACRSANLAVCGISMPIPSPCGPSPCEGSYVKECSDRGGELVEEANIAI